MKKVSLFLVILFFSCSSKLNHKNEFYEKGGVNEAIMNSINDFTDNSPLLKKKFSFFNK